MGRRFYSTKKGRREITASQSQANVKNRILMFSSAAIAIVLVFIVLATQVDLWGWLEQLFS